MTPMRSPRKEGRFLFMRDCAKGGAEVRTERLFASEMKCAQPCRERKTEPHPTPR